ncbi:MAG: SCP2 sterol-binding domain-containing protein [Acidimicrobiia bacterium]
MSDKTIPDVALHLDVVLNLDGVVHVLGLRDGQIQSIATPDPERTVTLTLTAADAERVRAGTINAQQLLQEGALRVGGRIDVLQAAAGALSALGAPPRS